MNFDVLYKTKNKIYNIECITSYCDMQSAIANSTAVVVLPIIRVRVQTAVPRFQPVRFRGFQRFRAGYGSVLHFSTRIRHVFNIGSCRFRTGPGLNGFRRLKTRFGACRFSRFSPFGHLYIWHINDITLKHYIFYVINII